MLWRRRSSTLMPMALVTYVTNPIHVMNSIYVTESINVMNCVYVTNSARCGVTVHHHWFWWLWLYLSRTLYHDLFVCHEPHIRHKLYTCHEPKTCCGSAHLHWCFWFWLYLSWTLHMSRTLHMPHTADMSRTVSLSRTVSVSMSRTQCMQWRRCSCTLITLMPVAVITYVTIPVLIQCISMHLHGSGYLYVTNCLCHINLYDLDVSMRLPAGGVDRAYNIC